VLYFYLTWRDPSAYDTVRNATADWLAGSYACRRPCTDWVGGQSCCDGIYLPTFFFRCWPAAACGYVGRGREEEIRQVQRGADCHLPATDCTLPSLCQCTLLPMPAFPCSCRNAFGFPQDRATGYKLYALPPPNSSLLWTQFVHGVFYQAGWLDRDWPAD
jgi:hypothetical protein